MDNSIKSAYTRKTSESVKKQLLIDNSVLLGIHLFLAIPYLFLSPKHMSFVNLFSILFYIGCFVFLKKDDNAAAKYSYLVLAEIMLHDICCVLVFGWECEFQLWIITLISTFIKDYITPDKSEKSRKLYITVIVAIGFFVFVALYLATKYLDIPFADHPSDTVVTIFALINALIGFTGMSAFTTIYVRQMELKYSALHQMADYDQLTGLGNRYYMLDLLAKEENTDNCSYSVAMIDIDFFKNVNDTYGHNNGDIVLSDLAKILSTDLPEGINAGRWGGEEFLLIADHTVAYEDFLEILEKLRGRVSTHLFVFGDSQKIHCTVSLGAATWQKGQSIQNVIQNADAGLYEAKKGGRNLLVAS